MPIVPVPVVGPAYKSRDLTISAQTCRNVFPQLDSEGREQASLPSTAGTLTKAILEGSDRGFINFNGILWTVNGSSLYFIDSDFAETNVGTITGSDRCIMANDGVNLVIATGGDLFYYSDSDGLTEIVDENAVNPTYVLYLNSQFLLDNNDDVIGEFVVLTFTVDGPQIDPLDFAAAEGHPDDIVAMIAFRQIAYMFGSKSLEPWRNTGTGNPPWARVTGGVQPYGIAGAFAVTTTSEYIYWLDQKRIPRRTRDFSVQTIGNPALGSEFASYTLISDVIAFNYVQDNQQFVAFTFPTANRTWVFHEPSQSWFQLSHGVREDRHRATSMINIYGLNICADHTNGNIYEYSPDIFTDDGDAIQRRRDTATVHGGMFEVPGQGLFINEVEFIIGSGQTKVEGLPGQGVIPSPPGGICGLESALTQGLLLSPTLTTNVAHESISVFEDTPFTNGVSFNDSKIISFTVIFSRATAPASNKAGVIDLYSSAAGNLGTRFAVYMNSSGHMKVLGYNDTGTLILDAAITNLGASFADGAVHKIAAVINLSDVTKREVNVNGTERAEGAYVTWNTYTDDTIDLADDGTAGKAKDYHFGEDSTNGAGTNGVRWSDQVSGTTTIWEANTDTLAFVSFDDACSLIPSAVFSGSNIRDPGKWEGWYLTQPQVFYGPSFYRNTGKTEPASYDANDLEKAWDATSDRYIYTAGAVRGTVSGTAEQQAYTEINGGLTDSLALSVILPPDDTPDTENPTEEIIEPFWENVEDGTWVDLNKLIAHNFTDYFGVSVDGADFTNNFDVNPAVVISMNSTEAGNRIRINAGSGLNSTRGTMMITNPTGAVISHVIKNGYVHTPYLDIPVGDFRIVMDANAGQLRISKYFSIDPNTSGSTSYESVFPPIGSVTVATRVIDVPAGGKTLWFTVPVTTEQKQFGFIAVPNTSSNNTKSGSISTTVGDFTAVPNNSNLTSGVVIGGVLNKIQKVIDNPTTLREFIPGRTYFMNFRYTNGEANVITIRTFWSDA